MRVLGIETSCDETGVAIYDSTQGLMSNILYSQVENHAQYGGVVPELASRDHIRKLALLVEEALQAADTPKSQLDAIAYTQGPGLIGALLVGATFAKSFAYGLNVPAIGLHHLEAHLAAPLLESPQPSYPFVGLLVSGGHTQLLAVERLGHYQLLGETLDDAVGEAFDKSAKLMGLSYPGGPKLAKLAQSGDPLSFKLPRPMTDRPGMDLSFSGLKTQVLIAWQNSDQTESVKADLAASFEKAICDTLVIKCRRAIQATGFRQLVVSGGVSANTSLRQALTTLMEEQSGEVFFPRLSLCTDNGAMVAYLGWLHLQQPVDKADKNLSVDARARWPLSD